VSVGPLPENSTTLPPLDQRAWSNPTSAYQPSAPPTNAKGEYLTPQEQALQNNPLTGGMNPALFWGPNSGALQALPGATGASLDILRRRNTVPPGVHQNQPSQWVGKTTKKANAQQYEAEYWEEAIKDPEKRMWLAKRAIMLGFAKYDPTSQWMVAEDAFTKGGVYQMWKQAGEIVQMNPTLNQMTPEEYLDSMYGRLGGDQGLQTGIDSAKAAEPNPIQKTTQVSKYSMSTEQAAAIADQVATAALGRMASEGEMAKARKAMNRLMAANPTVSTTVSDSTDPNHTKVSTNTKAGVGPDDAAAAYEMKMKRSSEGMAFNVGKLMETAMSQMDRGL
jgi:hypothetical protein